VWVRVVCVWKIFQRESSTFLFAFCGRFAVLIGVSGSVGSCFWVRFYVVMGAHECWLACASEGLVYVGLWFRVKWASRLAASLRVRCVISWYLPSLRSLLNVVCMGFSRLQSRIALSWLVQIVSPLVFPFCIMFRCA